MSSSALPTIAFHPTIPVVDMNDFFDPAKKQSFIDAVSQASQNVGFFAVINSNIENDVVDRAYDASMQFFRLPQENKSEIYKPELNGQRGWVPGETAQGHAIKDHKEFVHIGYKNNLWPTSMDLENPMMGLIKTLDKVGTVLQQAFAGAIGKEEDYFTTMTATGDSLLRALYYPKNPAPGAFWAGKHTDIDLFTLLPPATEEGLQVFHNGEWISVRVPPKAVIVNIGDKLQNLTNGLFKSSVHQVVSKPNIERFSIVWFVHPRNDDSMDPINECVALTGGVKGYPKATSFELLATRLRELGIASPYLKEVERDSGIMDRVKALVDAGNAALPVQLTWDLRHQGL
jgi:Isopenicillin N synthase and related dioxygenases